MTSRWTGTAQLLRPPAAFTGRRNMAIDEWLLSRAITLGQASFRFYRWNEPTLSLGYFQNKQTLTVPESLEHLARVRRLTGGGAILHDRELTYSLTLPADHPATATPVDLYRQVHQWAIDALATQGISAHFRGQADTDRDGAFLCFLRGDRNDVLIGEQKILGSAQRRRKGAVLQHGSLILQASPLAAEVAGVEELSSKAVDEARLVEDISAQLEQLAGSWQTFDAESESDLAEIAALEDRY